MQGEHSTGCTVLVLTIRTKFPLHSPDDHLLWFSDQCWRGKEHRSFCTSEKLSRVGYVHIKESLLSVKAYPGMFNRFVFFFFLQYLYFVKTLMLFCLVSELWLQFVY